MEAQQLAQTNPVIALSTRLGEQKDELDALFATVALKLKALDHTKKLLDEHGLHMTVTLGAIGDAAAHARRAAEADAERPGYELPRAVA